MSDAAAPAPAAPGASDLEAAGLSPKPSKLVPIVLGLNSLLLVGVLAKLFLMPTPAAASHEPPAAAPAGGEHGPVAPIGMGPTVKLPEFVVHLRNPEAERYARLSFELEVGVELDKDKLTAHMPKIRELFISYLSDCTMEDLRGSEGIERTKKDLLNKLAQAIPGSPVRGVFVTDIVIQ
ncbi:MAG: flagellar basal body-associated FliL family protein [Myxococcaceae bacterium]|nr:flagellar basal body-associated FliL family protein [Myxococcaceae bacterium]